MLEHHYSEFRHRIKSAIEDLIYLGLCKPQLNHSQSLEKTLDWIMTLPQTEQSLKRWEVWRMDDNGNQFKILAGLNREEAEQAVARYEAKGHKQTYWMQAEGSNKFPSDKALISSI